jgi:5-methylcytosine-specific restriction endonuclease McrA
MKEYAKAFYKSKAWQRTRYSYIVSKGGLCERCNAGGKIVHHKVYITPANINDEAIILNHANLELLCQDCHNKEHEKRQRAKVVNDGLEFTPDGQVSPLVKF